MKEEGVIFKPDYRLDASFQLCPVPILMTEEKMAELCVGEVLEVIYTDPGAKPDLEAWCAANGHPLLGFKEEKMKGSAFIQKGSREKWKK